MGNMLMYQIRRGLRAKQAPLYVLFVAAVLINW